MRVLYISLIVLVADQLSKIFIKGFSIPFLGVNVNGMHPGERIPVIGNFFRITFIENPGMAFGLDPGIDYKLLISLFSLAASIGLIIYLYYVKDESRSLKIGLAFILGGAAGNLIDRMFYGLFYNYAPLFYGRVVDFLDFDFFDVTIFGRSYDRWPIFNIADSAVTVGVLILLFFYRKTQKTEPVTVTGMAADAEELQHELPGELSGSPSIPEQKEESTPGNGEADKGKDLPL